MKHVKLVSLMLLMLLLVLSVAVACGDGDTDAETQEVTEGETTEAPDVTTSATTEPLPYEDLRPMPDVPSDAAAVDALIASIDGATLENEDKMDLAYLGYWSLSEEERAAVTGYETLQNLRSELLKAYVVKEYMDSRMPHHKFLIGAYMGPPTYSEQMVQDLIDANIDMVWRAGEACLERAEVGGDIKRAWDALNAAGIGMINELPFHTIRDGNGALIDALDYPNLWLVSGQDEPAVDRYDDLETLWDEVSSYFPECGYMNNLFPNYATISQLGTIYKSYLINYVETVTTDIISYDHYPYGNPANRGVKNWLNNLATVREVCLEYDKDMFVAVQMASSNPDYGLVTADQMRFQVNSAMCFGAKSVSWFLWTNVVWYGAAYDYKGGDYINSERTEQYDKVVEVNAEAKALEPVYMRYTTSGIGYLANKPVKDDVSYETYELVSHLRQTGMSKIDKSVVTGFTVEGTDIIQVGQFKKNVGDGMALMLLNITDFTYETKTTAKVTFTAVDYSAVVTAYVKGIPTILDPDENGVYTVEVSGADAVFLTFD